MSITPAAAPSSEAVTGRKPPSDAKPGSTLNIGITLPRPADGLGLTKYGARMTSAAVGEFVPEQTAVQSALTELERLGFKITQQGRVSVSVRGSRSLFERTFGTKLSVFTTESSAAGRYSKEAFYFPAPGAPWSPKQKLAALIDDAYIQWPHIYMAPSPIPPQVDYYHLRVPGDVTLLLNVDRAHRSGVTGEGVRVVMIDSGFAFGHPYYVERGYSVSTVLAPGANQPGADGNGHGTGEAANLLAAAPDVTFVGVKLDNETSPNQGASILEGLQEAIRHDPQVISVSLGFDLVGPNRQHLTFLPNNLKALEAEIQAAVAAGIVVVFSAGNGHVAFPGMIPDVISAGGTFVDEDGEMIASDYASAFTSKIYLGRQVPDFTGLVGLAANDADYIMLPIPESSEIDRENSQHDGTAADDSWGVFSGTSAAAPQLAGLCALLLQKDPTLTPANVKAILNRTARDVKKGAANAASNQGVALKAGVGPDSATGAGLVDAFAALEQV